MVGMNGRKEKRIEMKKDIQVIDTFIMEGSKGKYLRINCTEDGNGTWFDWTDSVWEAYWNHLENLEEIADTEFSDFEKGYPKFHRMRFTCEWTGTVEG
jgi:hypothetical protein